MHKPLGYRMHAHITHTHNVETHTVTCKQPKPHEYAQHVHIPMLNVSCTYVYVQERSLYLLIYKYQLIHLTLGMISMVRKSLKLV